jgi:hypothetical protein
MGHTLPDFVVCDECGAEARVGSCGRVEYDWLETSSDGQLATMPKLRWARLVVDCPHCGVKQQDIRIGGLDTPIDEGTESARSQFAPRRRISRSFRKPK